MRIESIAGALLALILAGAAQAQGRLPSPQGGDLVPDRLVAAPDPGFAQERKPVSFAWALDSAANLETSRPFVAESREFYATVEGVKLRGGYAVLTTAPGAVVRISPATEDAAALSAKDLELQVQGRRLPATQAVERAATAEQLRQAGMDVSEGTLAFRVRPELGAGRVELRAGKARGRYLVHVYEPNSPFRLYLGSERDSTLAGERLRLSGRLYEGDRPLAPDSIGGLLVAPDGRSFALDFSAGSDGAAVAEATLPAEAAAQPGLWEVHTFATSRQPNGRVLRDGKIAIAVAAPTARLGEGYRIRKGKGLKVSLEVETAAPGRYEVGAVLYGTDAQGQLRPLAAGRSAAWLEAGGGELTLRFGPELLGRGLGAPYALRDLSLTDQSRMGRLEQRALGPEGLGAGR